jgi:hypothetical protein
MTAALVDFVLRFREREREIARETLTLEIAEGVRVAVPVHKPPLRRQPPSALARSVDLLR